MPCEKIPVFNLSHLYLDTEDAVDLIDFLIQSNYLKDFLLVKVVKDRIEVWVRVDSLHDMEDFQHELEFYDFTVRELISN